MTVAAKSLSVVVAAWNDPSLLRACLHSLAAATQHAKFEVIVASPAGRGFEGVLATEFPQVMALTVGATPTVPELRKAGLDRATGDIVAFLEDHAAVAPEWAGALLAAYASADRAAVGGPVAQGSGLSTMDWGAYLFDYGRFMPPHAGGEVRELSGLNMSFSRALLESLDVLRAGVIEGPLLAELARRHVKLYLSPSAIVNQNKTYALGETLVSVYHLGRGYAGRRLEQAPITARVVRAVACALLPVVLLWRVLAAVLPKRQHTRRVMSSLGFLSLITLSWSIGECVGYLRGSGDSDSRWR